MRLFTKHPRLVGHTSQTRQLGAVGRLVLSISVKRQELVCSHSLTFTLIQAFQLDGAMCSAPNTLMFPTWPPQRQRQQQVAPGVRLFLAENTLVEKCKDGGEQDTINSSAWGFFFSDHSNTLMHLSGSVLRGRCAVAHIRGALKCNNDYRLQGRTENLAHANHL